MRHLLPLCLLPFWVFPLKFKTLSFLRCPCSNMKFYYILELKLPPSEVNKSWDASKIHFLKLKQFAYHSNFLSHQVNGFKDPPWIWQKALNYQHGYRAKNLLIHGEYANACAYRDRYLSYRLLLIPCLSPGVHPLESRTFRISQEHNWLLLHCDWGIRTHCSSGLRTNNNPEKRIFSIFY